MNLPELQFLQMQDSKNLLYDRREPENSGQECKNAEDMLGSITMNNPAV